MTARAEVWAEFASAEQLLTAVDALKREGVRPMDAFTPFAVPELEAALALRRPWHIPWLALCGAGAGGWLAFGIIWWTAAIDYPLNVGGRPLSSLPADIPIVFESCVLGAVLMTFWSMLLTSGMPRLHHRLELLPGFPRASIDRYWLGLDALDPAVSRDLLTRLGALSVHELAEPTP